MPKSFFLLCLCGVVFLGCGSSSSDLFHSANGATGATGAVPSGSGGSGGASGTMGSGGAPGGGVGGNAAGTNSGGVIGFGGLDGGNATGGTSASGGTSANGGASGNGGTTGGGGTTASGGSSGGGVGAGGTTANGGANASGGSGGATADPYQSTAAAECNGTPCSTAGGAACCTIVSSSGGQRTVYATCTPAGSACALPVTTAAHCDGPEDCGQGFVCCGTLSLPGIYSELSCVPSASCTGTGKQVMCHPRNGGGQCNGGGCNTTLTLPDGYGACG